MVLDWAKAEMLIRPSVHGLVLTGLGLMAPNWGDVTIQEPAVTHHPGP
jgi:hypothetical protein